MWHHKTSLEHFFSYTYFNCSHKSGNKSQKTFQLNTGKTSYNSKYLILWTSQEPSLRKRRKWSHIGFLPAFYLSPDHLKLETSCLPGIMEKVQYLTRSAIRRASTIEMPQQARQNLQNLFVNFCLILICLLLICIIVMLLWSSATVSSAAIYHPQLKICHPMKKGKTIPCNNSFPSRKISLWKGQDTEQNKLLASVSICWIL